MSARQYGVRLTLASTSPVPSYNVAPFVSGVLSLASHEDFGNGDETFTAGYLLSCSDIADRVDIAQGGNYAQIGDTTIELTNAGGVLATLEAAGVSLYGAKVEILSLVAPATATVRWIGIVVDQSWQGAKIQLRVESVLSRKHKLIPQSIVTSEEYPLAAASFVGKPIPTVYGTAYEAPAYPINGVKSCSSSDPYHNAGNGYWALLCRSDGFAGGMNVYDNYAPGQRRYDFGLATISGKTITISPSGTVAALGDDDDYIVENSSLGINRSPLLASNVSFVYDTLINVLASSSLYVEIYPQVNPSNPEAIARITAIAPAGGGGDHSTWTLTLDQTPQLSSTDILIRIYDVETQYVGLDFEGSLAPNPYEPSPIVNGDGLPIQSFSAPAPPGNGFTLSQPLVSAAGTIRGRVWIPGVNDASVFDSVGSSAFDGDADTYYEFPTSGPTRPTFTIAPPDLSGYDPSVITSIKVIAFVSAGTFTLSTAANSYLITPQVGYDHNWIDGGDQGPTDNWTRLKWLPWTNLAGITANYSGALPYGAGITGDPEASLDGLDVFDENLYQAAAADVTDLFKYGIRQTEGITFEYPATGATAGGWIRFHEVGYVLEYEIDRTNTLYWTGWQTGTGTPTATNAGVSICATTAEVLYANKICIDPTASDSDVRNNVVPTVDEASAEAADTDLAQINGEAYEVESWNSNVCRIQLDSQINSADFLAMVARDWNLIIAPDTTGAEVFTAFLRDMGSNTYAYSVTDSDMVEGSIAGVDLTAIEDLVNEPIVRFDYSSRQGLTRAVRIRSIETDPATLTATNYTQYVTGVGDFSTALAVFQILHQSWQRYGFKAQGEFEKKTVPYLQDRYSPQGGLYSDTLSINYEPIRTTLTAAVGTSWLEWVSSRKKILSFTVLESQSAAAAPLGSRFRVSHYRYTAGSYVYGTLAERIWNPTDGTCTLSVMLDPTPYTAATLVYRDTIDASFDTARDTLNASLDTLQDSLGA